MALLASIDEVCNTASPNQPSPTAPETAPPPLADQASRPRSRVVFVAARHPRARSIGRKTLLAKRRKTASLGNDGEGKVSAGKGHTTAPQPKQSGEDAEPAIKSGAETVDGANADQGPSSISLELASFPMPPSGGACSMQETEGATSHVNANTGLNTILADPPQVPAAKGSGLPSDQSSVPIQKPAKQASPIGWPGDAAVSQRSPPELSSSDSALVDAISRNIVQQLRLLSMTDENAQSFVQDSEETHQSRSRTSTQRARLDRFTKDLQRYADNMGATGKILNFTPTPTRSGATLRTVSALMPFRPEFREAGLAVTSRDQDQRIPAFLKRNNPPHASERVSLPVTGHRFSPSQLDGHVPGRMVDGPHYDSFMGQGLDDWRMAMQARNTTQRPRPSNRRNPGRSRCLPCFPGQPSETSDGGSSRYDPMNRNLGSMAAITSRMLSSGPADSAYPQMPGDPLRAGSARPPPPRQFKRDLATSADISAMPPINGQSMRRRTDNMRSRNHPRMRRDTNAPRDTCDDPLLWGSNGQRPRMRPAPGSGRYYPGRFPMIPPNIDQALRASRRPYQSLPSNRIAQALSREYHYTAGQYQTNCSVPELMQPRKPATSTERTVPELMGEVEKDKPAEAADVFSPGSAPPITTPSHASPPLQPIASHEGLSGNQDAKALKENRRPAVPKRTSSIRDTRRLTKGRTRAFTDRDVLRGLNVAASAACDEDVDAYVRHKTGLQIRRFLADLVVLETLGDEKTDDAAEIIKQRRVDMKRLKQHVRRTREFKRISRITQ